MSQQSPIEIYQTDDGQAQVEIRLEQDTFWLSQKQVAVFFDKDSDTIGLHLKHIFKEGELDEKATTEEYSVVRQEGRRQVQRSIKHYNLDAIISVGYRVNSKKGTQFRIWATQRLKEHLLYFVVKNHPFSDGNKRSGAFLFVAESDPKQKETLIHLVMHMISRESYD